MAYVAVLPEFGLVVDPLIGLVTRAGLSYQPVIDKVVEVEMIADDLVNMLSAEGNFLASFPGREGTLGIAGGITSFWYGLAIGLFIAGIIALQLLFLG
jgi:tetrahydromethanopterin S-methyltransferase subunit B